MRNIFRSPRSLIGDFAHLILAAGLFGNFRTNCFVGWNAGRYLLPPKINEPTKKNPAEVMRELRLMQLTAPPTRLEKPTSEFPKVRAVVMDWPIEAGTVSVVARSTGDASIYTT